MRLFLISILLFIGFFAACVPAAKPEPAASDSQSGSGVLDVVTMPPLRPSATPTVIQPDTPLPTDTPTVDPTVLTRTPWPPDPLPSPTPAPPFPGMAYKTNEGLWIIDSTWQPQFLNADPGASPGPDNHLLFEEAGDIWLWDSDTQEAQNLTNTPNHQECCVQMWQGYNRMFYLRNFDVGSGIPFLHDLASGEVTALAQGPNDITLSEMAGSPDGRTLAYELNGNSLWFYDVEKQTAVNVNPADYGYPNDMQIARLGAPSWSPDGQQLAVIIAVETPQIPWQIALGIFDLTNKTAEIYHPYQNVGRGGWFPPAPWSPNGDWIAFVTEDENPERRGLWLIRPTDGEEKQIPTAFNPIWSPDGKYLIYQTREGTYLTYPPDFIYQIGITLPQGATVIEWGTRP